MSDENLLTNYSARLFEILCDFSNFKVGYNNSSKIIIVRTFEFLY
jgi:hypothetical protein